METIKESDLVVRHNNLINANIRLDAKEYDIVRTFMKYITRDDSDFWTFTVRAADLNIHTSRGKSLARSISRKPVEIDLSNDGLVSIPFFTKLKYQQGVFEGKFNNDLRDVLLEMEGNFTKTYEKYILPMDSIYAKRIYELLSENMSIGYRKFRLDDLYETLQVPKSFMKYSKFKEKVLLIAIKEINKHTDIYIPVDTENLRDESWLKLQCGIKRGVTHINFEFRKKDDQGLFAKPIENRYTKFIVDKLYLDKIENELNYLDVEVMREQEIFLDFCKKEEKIYTNMSKSFYIHLKKKRELGL